MKITLLPCLFFLLALLMAGCVLYDFRSGPSNPIPNAEKLGIKELPNSLSAQPICKELSGPTPCYCMFCENKTPWQAWVPILTLWYDASLVGGNCSFVQCNASSFVESVEDNSDLQARVFMVGQGPGFYSAGRANLYCNYSLQLATKWLVGNTTPPKLPKKSAAECWLERNILPIYIYYTGGKGIDPAQTGRIASELNGAGPAIITTELNFNSSDANAVSLVKQQLVAIKASCPDCLSVLAVQSGDLEGVRKVLNDTSLYNGKTLWNLTDMVGFGFRANDYATCSDREIIYHNMAFSQRIMQNLSKPTIWLYVGASEGNSSDGGCTFDAAGVHRFYQDLFAATAGLSSSGVVGMSMYEFYDRSGPLPCNGVQGCDFGVYLANGSQKHPEMNTWSGMCQLFANGDYRSPLMFSRNGQGYACDIFANRNIEARVAGEVNSQAGLNYGEVEPYEAQPHVGCGETCVSEGSLPSSSDYLGTSKFTSDMCFAYPLLDERADDAGLSQLYLRATAAVESGFDPKAISCAPRSSSCNPLNLNMSDICSLAGNPEGCDSSKTCPSGEKPCAFGLMQCTEYPGQLYLSKSLPIPSTISGCGAESYNPFNPPMSICCGVGKFGAFLSQAQEYIGRNWGTLSECRGGLEEDDRDYAAYFLASLYYNMGPANVPSVQIYKSWRDNGGRCRRGNTNYIAYLKSQFDYPANVMASYIDAIDECNSDCPS